MLGVIFLTRTSMGFQFQSIAALTPFLVPAFDLSYAEVGLLMGLFMLPGVVIAVPGGLLGQRFGSLRVVIGGLGLMIVGGMIVSYSPGLHTAAFGRTIGGVGGVLVNIMLARMVAGWFRERELQTAMGLMLSAWPFGMALALVILGPLAAHTSWRIAEYITVVAAGGKSSKANLAGRDPSTDLAILKVSEESALPLPSFGDGGLKLGHVVLALGRSRGSNLVASAGIVGGISGEWEPRRGGRVDQHIRLSLELYPGFSGGPLVNAQGKVVGINTRGLSRGRAVTIPLATVNRIVDELIEKGHIAKPYLGLAMQPVAVPESLRGKVPGAGNSAVLVVHVEPAGPAL